MLLIFRCCWPKRVYIKRDWDPWKRISQELGAFESSEGSR